MEINSKRKFAVTAVEEGQQTNMLKTLDQLLIDDGFEITYALQDILDEILDLKVKESMYFQCNRDNERSKGIIFRIK